MHDQNMIDSLRGEKNRRYYQTASKLLMRSNLVSDQYAHIFYSEIDRVIDDAFAKVEAKRITDNGKSRAA